MHNISDDFSPELKILGSVLVAQLDRVLASEAEGCGFESRRGYSVKYGLLSKVYNTAESER